MINNKSIYHIVTTSGKNSTSVTINWQSDFNDCFVLLKKESSEFNKIMPTNCFKWDTKNTINASCNDTFYENSRYCYNASLFDLEEGTYEYKITNNKEESAINQFVISKKEEFNFIALCDLQHPNNEYSKKLVDALNNISKDANILTCSGDLTGTAAYEKEWTWLLDNDQIFKDKIIISSVGDHEYWGDYTKEHIPQMKIPDTYNHLLKNPDNGSFNHLNSSYYVIYNNVLFIAIDMGDSNTCFGEIVDEQIDWFMEVVKKEEGNFKHLIVISHKSIYGSTYVDSGVCKYLRPKWQKVFDECHVDLVISGHDHLYSRTKRLYNNEVNNEIGTYYLDLGSSGNKRRKLDGTTDDDLHEKLIDISSFDLTLGAIVSIKDGKIFVKVFDQFGNLQDSFIC